MRLLSRTIALVLASLGCTHAPAPSTIASPDVRLSSSAAAQAQNPNRYPPFPADYRCVPFHDARYSGGAQKIPGRLQNEYYDQLDVGSDAQSKGVEEGRVLPRHR